jgi:hypothetical protein
MTYPICNILSIPDYDTEISMSGKNLPSYVTMDHLICLLFQT